MALKTYYYLVSSLPMLKLGDDPPFSSSDFLAMCRSNLDARSYRQLERVSLVPDGMPATVVEAAWQAWESYLRNYLAHERAERRGLDALKWLRAEPDAFPSARAEFDDALSEKKPADRERALDQARWQRLDDLAVMHDFDVDALLIYRLKLLLVEKWTAQSVEDSMGHLEMLVGTAVSQAEQKHEITR